MHSSCAQDRSILSSQSWTDRNRHARRVAVHDGDEDEQRRRAHQDRDQPFLEAVEDAHQQASLPALAASRSARDATAGRARACGRSRHRLQRRQSCCVEAGFLVDLVDRVLADARLHAPCAPARAPCCHAAFCSGVSVDDLGLAGLLDLGQRLVVLLLRDLVGVSRSPPSSPSRAGRGCRPAGRPRTSC